MDDVDELNRLAIAIEQTVTGPMWHGSALADLLRDVTAADAARHPIDGAHSIWELVRHIAAWARIVESRLATTARHEPTDADDWPPVVRTTPAAWALNVVQLHAAHELLAGAVRRLEPTWLDALVPGRAYSVRTMLHGVPEHGAYHGGQIALLTRSLQNRRTP